MATKLKVLNAPRSKSLAKVGTHNGGHVYYVKQATAADFSKFYDEFFIKYDNGNSSIYNTLAEALAVVTANVGDVIYVAEGYTETVTAASGLALNKAGVAIYGLGSGSSKPTITIASTDNSGTVAVSGADVTWKDFIVVGNDDALTNAVVVTGSGFDIDIETRDTSASVEMATAVRLDTVSNGTLKLKHAGFTAGNAMVSCVRLDGCSNVRIDIDGYGVLTTAWVEMVDVLSTNIVVKGAVYTQGVTNGSRDVVDTITGSKWFGALTDMSAGVAYSGGSGQAWATTDVTGLAAAIDAIDNFVDTEVASILTASGATNDSALVDTIEGASGAVSMIALAKGILQRIGADSANNTASTSLVAANPDGSMLERQEYVQTDMLALPRCIEKTDGAVLSGDDILFNITGGPIHVLEIVGIVTTEIGAGTTNVKLQIDTATPAATVDISAGAVDIDGDAAGTSYETINTTGVFTPVTAGYVKHANSFATNPTDFIAPIGDIVFNSSAARAGVIAWYMRYVPLSPNSRVVAAA